ncbi:hypothetical protein [Oharaeibacter diazotrophicus]|uniref:Uncharacterized protein n=1 Tax=Oharaeibacter diazotrophicus TaxID=1920512 RepID=A0A4R6RJW8_9HYPH|nr:hypothetical protein [Oharaeibacter diazotrophicus]TDP86780.1 hypothetical protein EDD54_0663 [Oharaeibacter diazotrophicus]BBE71277.1 hypothetical protein OHA_1_00848 [Pleomorphomonas sp. SM30]GLS78032.1 hypothetical protein GCM10007904_33690 [Oharaeibacter diazotrophicus]
MLAKFFLPTLLLATALTGHSAAALEAGKVERVAETIGGVAVDTFRWYDSAGLVRSVSFKKQGSGNTGNGGYAIRMTYQYRDASGVKNVVAPAPAGGDGGFGYFVSHERYRDFADGSQDTIAGKIFHADDSPLGLGFPATIGTAVRQNGAVMAYAATIAYPRYGTVAQRPVNANGSDSPALPLTASAYARYLMPATQTWYFQSGRDYPLVRVQVNMSGLKPDQASFDVRAPYGVLAFDNGGNSAVGKVMWGDRKHFVTTTNPVTRNSSWTWNAANSGGRYVALIANGYEMGMFEPKPFASSSLRDGYADERGSTSATYRGGKGCEWQTQLLPCDWEWPYQSLQYSLPYDSNTTPTTGKKIAWGSSAFYGTGPGLKTVWDSPTTSQSFVGYPSGGILFYDVCVVLGRSTAAGLTKTAAGVGASLCSTFGL